MYVYNFNRKKKKTRGFSFTHWYIFAGVMQEWVESERAYENTFKYIERQIQQSY